ncbi:DUF5689 domain-containing protein [Spongiimicrobium sp. 3-5]|uniref:DUF5689 domain-containing protein n=1 Tax=Spongiimicrobium sp. 3-5 TaxID=3332596 RepID=UPI00397F9C9C
MKSKQIIIFFIFLGMGCVKNPDFDTPKSGCVSEITANTSFDTVKNMYVDELIQIQEDLVIEGYVISSDRAGNFFGTLYLQDNPVAPTAGFQMEVDVRESHVLYPIGSKILIRLQGLYLGKSKGVFKLGGVFAAFGNPAVGRLPGSKVVEHIFKSCDEPVAMEPLPMSVEQLQGGMNNTLVVVNDIEVLEEEVGLPFAYVEEETERTLIDCADNTVKLVNSGFADFRDALLPSGSGNITAVLIKENTTPKLIVRDLGDIDFSNERCAELVTEFTSNSIFISELADPNNNTGARFVELYNAGEESLSLNGWTLRRYTNASTEVSSTIDLSQFVIGVASTLVISPNESEFETVYGFGPDVGVTTNSPADSNGDDNLELVDPFGTVIDAYGIVGEDGTGTNHEFEDGRAVRKAEVTEGSAVYTFSEWTIYNDSGNAGTINSPQNAPEDFGPGER